MSTTLPVFSALTTDRLVIRLLEERDLQDLFRVNGDPETTHFLPYSAWLDMEDAQSWYARTVSRCEDGNAQQVVLELKASSTVIGTALLFRYDHANRRAEIGYVLGRQWWHQGLMKEALQALCLHAFTTVQLRRLEAEVDIGNDASNGVIKALGFSHEGTLRERWLNQGRLVTTHLYSCLEREWPGTKS